MRPTSEDIAISFHLPRSRIEGTNACNMAAVPITFMSRHCSAFSRSTSSNGLKKPMPTFDSTVSTCPYLSSTSLLKALIPGRSVMSIAWRRWAPPMLSSSPFSVSMPAASTSKPAMLSPSFASIFATSRPMPSASPVMTTTSDISTPCVLIAPPGSDPTGAFLCPARQALCPYRALAALVEFLYLPHGLGEVRVHQLVTGRLEPRVVHNIIVVQVPDGFVLQVRDRALPCRHPALDLRHRLHDPQRHVNLRGLGAESYGRQHKRLLDGRMAVLREVEHFSCRIVQVRKVLDRPCDVLCPDVGKQLRALPGNRSDRGGPRERLARALRTPRPVDRARPCEDSRQPLLDALEDDILPVALAAPVVVLRVARAVLGERRPLVRPVHARRADVHVTLHSGLDRKLGDALHADDVGRPQFLVRCGEVADRAHVEDPVDASLEQCGQRLGPGQVGSYELDPQLVEERRLFSRPRGRPHPHPHLSEVLHQVAPHEACRACDQGYPIELHRASPPVL